MVGIAKNFTWATLLAASVLVTSCVHPPVAQQHPVAPELRINVPGTPGLGPTYVRAGVSFDSSASFMAKVDDEIAAGMARLKVQSAPIGSLRIILPVRPAITLRNDNNPQGAAEAVATYANYQRDLDKGRLAGLKKANIFAPIQVSAEQVSVADNDGADFVLWFTNGQWQLRYHKGDTAQINDFADIAQWTTVVSTFAHNALRDAENGSESGLRYTAHMVGTINDKPRFHFDGADYFSAADLQPAMMSAWLQAAAEVKPIARPVGRRIKIVVPVTFRSSVAYKAFTGVRGDELRQAEKDFNAATTAGYIDAIRNSHMFSQIDIVKQDVVDVPLDSYDVTLWHPAESPFVWAFRVAGQKDARTFVWPSPNPSLQEWVDALAMQMSSAPSAQ